jgi:enoyl-CoA hydratase/carnithine racemase
VPTVAAVSGLALGGGAELAAACDVIVADAGAVFAFPETRLGILPGAGGTQRLPRLVGVGAAMELIMTGRRVGAAEAHGMGLVQRVAADGGTALGLALEVGVLATLVSAPAPEP